jgi:hypothetical protein
MRIKIMKSKSRSRPKTRRSSRKKSGGFLEGLFNSPAADNSDDLPWHKKFTTSLTNLFSSDKDTAKDTAKTTDAVQAPVNNTPAPAPAPVNNVPAPVNNVPDNAEWYTPPPVPENTAGPKMPGLPPQAQAQPLQAQQDQFRDPNAATGGRRRTSNKRNKNKHNKNKRK